MFVARKGIFDNDLVMDKSNRFYLARVRTGLSQTEVAARLGLNKTAVSKWEGNKTLPEPTVLMKLARLYNVSIDYLLDLPSESQLFDDARVERPEVLELFEKLTSHQKELVLERMRAYIDANEERGLYVGGDIPIVRITKKTDSWGDNG